jgi:hypothetical protein
LKSKFTKTGAGARKAHRRVKTIPGGWFRFTSGAEAHLEGGLYRSAEALRHPKAGTISNDAFPKAVLRRSKARGYLIQSTQLALRGQKPGLFQQ